MARSFRKGPAGKNRAKGRKKKRFREEAKCRFCREKVQEVDYKDVNVLAKLTTQQGKLFSRKRSGNCSKHQLSCKLAIKRARFLALMPYVT